MTTLPPLLVLTLFLSISPTLTSPSMASEAFKKHEVVPDVVPTAPNALVTVIYDKHAKANLGNELTPAQVLNAPTVSWTAEDGALYTLVMTDPDAPSRQYPKLREWPHWVVVNIPGNDVSNGETLAGYVGCGPPQGTGLHRYVFLVYKQLGKIVNHEQNISGDDRGGWRVAKFAEKHKLGNPIAGNLFQTQWDESVPKLYRNLLVGLPIEQELGNIISFPTVIP